MRNAFDDAFHAIDDKFTYVIRPIQKDDKQKLINLFNCLSPQSRYLRFAHAMSKLPVAFLEDVLELDYEKEMALVAIVKEPKEADVLIGIARYVSDVSGNSCEFSISVSDHYSAHGVGMNLMKHLLNYAQQKGLRKMVGYILSSNAKMLQMIKELGFKIETPNDASDFKIATLDLQK